ncbi:50S ribosomal protein L20 [Sesamum angolense]|uniref:Large ribosomal subunit protein bL20c n=1 Tax=Sesamum angolense TaxID=2727404 RepID=A0AAE1W461_9LAMI|nr:50S ribosomal protein L20 [Sesamum angolense]
MAEPVNQIGNSNSQALMSSREPIPASKISTKFKAKPFKISVPEEKGEEFLIKMNKKEVLKLAKGFRGRAKNCIRIARERVEKALQYSYRDRRNKKRDMRSLWIQRINAGTRHRGVNYGNFMHGLMKENIQLNRKVLSELSMHEPYSFKALVDISRNAFPGNKTGISPKKEGLAILV